MRGMRLAFCSPLGRRGVDRNQAPSRTAFSMRSSHSDQAVRTTARNSSLTASPSHRLMNVTPVRDGPRSRKRILMTDAYQRVRTPIALRPHSERKGSASRCHAAPPSGHDDGLQTPRHRAVQSRRRSADPRAETQAERRKQQRHKCGHAKHGRARSGGAPGPRGGNRRRYHA